MIIRSIQIIGAGWIPQLTMIGFHGRIGIDQTPAQRCPVFSCNDRLARIITNSWDEGDGDEIDIEISSRKLSDDSWAHGTKIDPGWTATFGDRVVVIGKREMAAYELIDKNTSRELAEFLFWTKTGNDRSDDIRCIRFGDLAAWYTSPCLIRELRTMIAKFARARTLDAARRKNMNLLQSESFWLSRSAVEDRDIILAAAGLKMSGNENWQLVLKSGISEWAESIHDQVDSACSDLRRLAYNGR